MNEVEKLWQSHWKAICTHPNGSIDLEQIKKELYDFSFLLEQVPIIYCAVTGGKLSKPYYPSRVVIDAFEDHVETLIDDYISDL